jgi:adenine-specific DNA-methyltransferase
VLAGQKMVNLRAKHLRKNMTEAEKWLWEKLRSRELEGFKFRRQRPIGPFIVDFVCLKNRLVVEVDGGQHAEAVEEDQIRSEFLAKEGYKVLRFWNHEILQNGEAVLTAIHHNLRQREPSPPPSLASGEGE